MKTSLPHPREGARFWVKKGKDAEPAKRDGLLNQNLVPETPLRREGEPEPSRRDVLEMARGRESFSRKSPSRCRPWGDLERFLDRFSETSLTRFLRQPLPGVPRRRPLDYRAWLNTEGSVPNGRAGY